ncbi:MAG: hypothetical protein V4582_16975 [Pseudomonadota bacterium]
MKTLLVLLSAALLGGCVIAPPGPANYGTRVAQAPVDPHQWHVVSVEPVAPGSARSPQVTSEALPAQAAGTLAYAPQPQTVYVPQPVYVEPAPYSAPYYYAPPYYFYPSLAIGLDLMFGGWCCHHGWAPVHRGHARHH